MNDLKVMDFQMWINKQKLYYKKRYEKALSLGIDESSKHYQAYLEIEQRYIAMSTALEIVDIMKKAIYFADAREYCQSGILMVAQMLSSGEYIIDENGRKEYLPHKVKLQKTDTEGIQASDTAKAAVERIGNMDFCKEDKEELYLEYTKDFSSILNWLLIAREQECPVNGGRRSSYLANAE